MVDGQDSKLSVSPETQELVPFLIQGEEILSLGFPARELSSVFEISSAFNKCIEAGNVVGAEGIIVAFSSMACMGLPRSDFFGLPCIKGFSDLMKRKIDDMKAALQGSSQPIDSLIGRVEADVSNLGTRH